MEPETAKVELLEERRPAHFVAVDCAAEIGRSFYPI